VVLLVVAALVLGVGQRDTGAAARARALQELRDAESAAGAQRFAADSAAERREEARGEAAKRGLATDAQSLRDLAERVEDAEWRKQDEARWLALCAQFQDTTRDASARLTAALNERGITALGDAAAALAQYEQECAARAALATEAARRPQLERALADRTRLEREHDERISERAAAEGRIIQARRLAGVPGDSPDDIVPGLRDWQRSQVESMHAREAARKDWYELQGLLGGGTLADLETAAEQRASRAAEVAAGLDPGAVRSVVLGIGSEARLTKLREADVSAQTALANAQGALDLYQQDMPSVPEAEEEVARCEAELARVQALDRVLTETTQFLERAQENVHRNIAPVLKATLREWLPRVTSGRYDDAVVDPATLAVRVQAAGRPLREVRLLSRGTAEQIYLLLRMAMATHLTLPGEVCPLLLDDVTVECDPIRRRAVLDVLHVVSRERQVVLFSQEAEVLAWARANLVSPQDGITELDPLLVPA
jgi:DNA repair exonuclease SbcCD ATPase subunit